MNRYLFLLQLRNPTSFEYDFPDGFVISAETPQQARRIAQRNSGEKLYNGTPRWMDPQETSVRRIGYSHVRQGIVLASTRHG